MSALRIMPRAYRFRFWLARKIAPPGTTIMQGDIIALPGTDVQYKP
jgi:hypothetical protein